MKKLFFALACLALPLVFTSCDDDSTVKEIVSDLTGSIKMTIGSQSQTFSVAPAYQTDGKTIIASSTGSQHIAITLDGTTAKAYTLGFMSDLNITSILAGGLPTSNMSSTLTYSPGGTSDIYEVVAGTCTVSSYSSSKISGSFSGYAVKLSDLEGGLSLSILTNAVKISGTFTAPLTNSLVSK